MNRLLLYLIMLPSGLWQRLGADPQQLRAILNVKLILDDRRPLTMGRQQKKKNQRFHTVWSMIISFATGFFYILFLFQVSDEFSALWCYFTTFILFLTFLLITDFSTALIDTRDKLILLSQPVNDRTIFLARTLHIYIYLFRVVLPMSLPGWVAIGLMYGWKAAVWFPVPVLALLFTTLFLVLGVYLLILRFATASKFREVLSYFQIAFSVIIFGAFYLMPKAADTDVVRNFNINKFNLGPLTPSYWFASTFSWLAPIGHAKSWIPLIGILTILAPMVLLWVTLRFLAPRFNAILSELDFGPQEAPLQGKASQPNQKSKRTERLAVLLNRRSEAQAGFVLTWIQTARSRSFKMKVYPLFAYVPIYFVYLIFEQQKPFAQVWTDLPDTSRHLFLLYMCSIVMLSAFSYLSVSEQYKAAWVYWAMPIQEPGALMAGAFKVIWLKFFLPFFGVISVFVLYVWGAAAISDVCLALVNVTLFGAAVARLMHRRFPFSELDASMKTGGRFFKNMAGLSVPFLLGAFHYIAIDLLWLKMLFMLLSLGMFYLVWDSYSHTSWAVINKNDKE